MPPTWFRPARIAVTVVVTALAAGALTAPTAQAVSAVTTRLVASTATVTDSSGASWLPDSAYSDGGRVVPVSRAVKRTAAPQTFTSARTGPSRYRIPVAAQSESVTLGFVAPAGTVAGSDVFDVVAEGRVVATGIDVAAAVGPLRAYRVNFSVRVTDGVLDLSFRPTRGVPSVANVRVVSSGAASTVVGALSWPGSPESFGAKADGVTDDTAALQQALDAATADRPVVLSPGRTYAHAGVLHLRRPGLHLTGAATLLATAEATSSVWIEADDVLVDGGVVIKTASTTRRWDAWEQMGIRIAGHTGATLRSVTVDGSAAAGIYIGTGATRFVLDRVTVQNTRADGIHMTGGASEGTLTSPIVRDSGDDGIAVVSYQQDGPACHDIQVTSPTVLGTTWGRGLSVVGGTRVTETDIDVRDTSAAAVYIAAEGNPWFTAAPQQVTIAGGSISGANTSPTVDHGAVLVMSGERGVVPAAVTVSDLAISRTRASASRNLGVITYGDPPTGVLFTGIAVTGGPALAYQGNTPASAYRLIDVTHDGVAVPVTG